MRMPQVFQNDILKPNHKNMKIYTHDYTKAAKAERKLTEAINSFANDDFAWAKEQFATALVYLRTYLSEDNEKLDRDVLGYIRVLDAFDEEQLCYIRDEFACIMEDTNNANGELGIINKCCRLLEDPEYDSFEDFKKNVSGTWAEKKIEED